MKINYEKARPSDYEEIYNVMQTSARELSRKTYSDELKDSFDMFYIDKTSKYIKQTLVNQHIYTIVAKNNNKIIGFIQFKFQRKIGNISHLYILPGYEGNSIGTQLFYLVKKTAIKLNIDKLYTESTLNALTYYEKFGFRNKGLISDESAYDLELEL